VSTSIQTDNKTSIMNSKVVAEGGKCPVNSSLSRNVLVGKRSSKNTKSLAANPSFSRIYRQNLKFWETIISSVGSLQLSVGKLLHLAPATFLNNNAAGDKTQIIQQLTKNRNFAEKLFVHFPLTNRASLKQTTRPMVYTQLVSSNFTTTTTITTAVTIPQQEHYHYDYYYDYY